MENWLIADALKIGTQCLSSSDSPRIDTEIILSHILKKTRTFLYTHPEYPLSTEEKTKFLSLIEARKAGNPVAYLTSQREFWSLPFQVTPDTLIPRPETELLVECGLSHLRSIPHAQILDLGTRSGAIALAIAHERPDCGVWAVDNSEPALAVARSNAEQLHLNQVKFYHSDWFKNLPEKKFHLIISNPPYIEENDPHLTQGDLRFEPRSALASGLNGLNALRHIITTAPFFLLPQGWLCVEHGYNQEKSIQGWFKKQGYQHVSTAQDIQGHARVTQGQFFHTESCA